jgi:hypothetical protein
MQIYNLVLSVNKLFFFFFFNEIHTKHKFQTLKTLTGHVMVEKFIKYPPLKKKFVI